MWKRRVFWGLGGAFLAALLIWLAVGVLEQTTFTTNLERREASAEATLGNLQCRKELKTTFPFFVLTCRDVQKPSGENQVRESSSAQP